MDKACIGEGATHNACPCFFERMAKLERVRDAAKSHCLGICPYKTGLEDALRETEER